MSLLSSLLSVRLTRVAPIQRNTIPQSCMSVRAKDLVSSYIPTNTRRNNTTICNWRVEILVESRNHSQSSTTVPQQLYQLLHSIRLSVHLSHCRQQILTGLSILSDRITTRPSRMPHLEHLTFLPQKK